MLVKYIKFTLSFENVYSWNHVKLDCQNVLGISGYHEKEDIGCWVITLTINKKFEMKETNLWIYTK